MTQEVALALEDDDPMSRSHLTELTRKVTAAFMVPPSPADLLAPIQGSLAILPEPYEEVRRAFGSNLEGLLSTVTIPFEMAHTSALDRHFQRLSAAERIRSLMLEAEGEETEAELDERRDRIARSQADATMRDFLGSKKGQESVIADTCLFLLRAVERDTLAAAAGELLLQGVVLAWGAFEVLARDCFVHFLNAKPDAVQRLLIDPSAKKRLDLGKVPLETLAAHGFDLSAKMGSLLAEQQDLSDIRSVKAVYGALFPNSPALRDALNSASLRLLSLRRNLVVHRRGIIDDTYRRGADEGAALGSRLVVSPQTLERHLSACLAAGRELLLMVSAG